MKTIKSKLIITELLLLIGVIGGACIFYLLFADTYYINKKEKLMERAYKEIKKLDFPMDIEKYNSKDNSEEDNNEINFFTFYEEENIKFIITDDQFRSLYMTDKLSDLDVTEKRINRRIKDKQSDFQYNAKAHKENNKRISLFGLIEQDGKNYYVYIYERTYVIEKSFTYANKLLFVTLIISIFLGSVLINISAGKISKPIEDMDLVAQNIASKNFTLKVSEKINYTELNRLARSINSMSNQLQDYILKLEKYNLNLLKENRYKSEMEKMRKQFVNNVSHELKTPLAVISSQVEMLYYLNDERKKEEYYNSLLDEVNHMNKLIESMLAIFSAEHGIESMELSTLNLSDLVNSLLETYHVLLEQKNIKYRTDIEKTCFVMGNKKYLEQAVSNYIMNAYKHTKSGNQIHIKVETDIEKNKVFVSVYNEGEKINEREKKKIWNSFYQGDNSNIEKTLIGGTGLGLYIVQTIIKLHHGDYGVENEKDGVLFWFSLDLLNKQNI